MPVDSTASDTVPTDTVEAEDTEDTETSKPPIKKPIQNNNNSNKVELPWKLKYSGSVSIRDLTIDVGLGGEEVTIIQLSDLHFADCTEEDLKNPTLASMYEKRKGSSQNSLNNAKRCLDWADTQAPDQIVITGDCLDYLSQGSLNLMDEYVWDRYREEDGSVQKVMAVVGNHEHYQQLQGTVPDTLSLEERYKMLEDNWEHDVYYSSKVLKDKVMLIQMHDYNPNGGYFWKGQAEKLSNDLAIARENGYTVLLFIHIPLQTLNQKYYNTSPLTGYGIEANVNYYRHNNYPGPTEGADLEVYNIITNNADLIAGVFCGHDHADYYSEINAKTADGTDKPIPQYTLTKTTAYLATTKITVK